MSSVPPVTPAPVAVSDLAKVKADLEAVKAKLAALDAQATSWLESHAHAFVTGALVVAVLYILHKIL
jgi:predicted neutral ceramidase superfamily lipid hydrolase